MKDWSFDCRSALIGAGVAVVLDLTLSFLMGRR